MQQTTDTKPRTSTLFRRIFKTADIKDFIESNEDVLSVISFDQYISALCVQMSKKKESVITGASIERTYGYQLFNGRRKPSRDKAIQLSFGFGLDLEGAQKLLQAAGKCPLYPRIKRDAAVIYCIEHKYGMIEVQAMLHELGLCLLGEK